MMRYLSTAASIFLFSVLTGCGDDPAPTEPDPVFRVAPDAQWAGGAIEVSSDALERTHDPVIVTSGGDTLVAVESAPGSVTALLPTHGDGPVEIAVILGGITHEAGTVDVYGSLGRQQYQPFLVSLPQDYPIATGAGVISYYQTPTDEGFAVLSLTTGAHVLYDAKWIRGGSWCRTPALGPTTDEAYLCASMNDVIDTWHLGQGAGVERTLHLRSAVYFTARLSEEVWLAADKSEVFTYRADFDGPGEVQNIMSVKWVSETQGFEFNRDLDVAIPAINYSPIDGIPAFRMSTGELAYWAGQTTDEEGNFRPWIVRTVTSSTSRSTFYIGGIWVGHDEAGLYAIDAAMGTLTAYRPIEGLTLWSGMALEYDPIRDLLYFFSETLNAVLIVDPATLDEVGRVDLSGQLPTSWSWSVLVLGQAEGVGYLLFTDADLRQREYVTPVVRFRLLGQ